MKTFNYHSTKDVKEASKLASSSSAFLAGGMTTLPSMKLGLASYNDIIDIKKIKKLSGIKVTGKTVTIGATVIALEQLAAILSIVDSELNIETIGKI